MKGKTFTISEIKEILASAKKSKHNEIIFGIDLTQIILAHYLKQLGVEILSLFKNYKRSLKKLSEKDCLKLLRIILMIHQRLCFLIILKQTLFHLFLIVRWIEEVMRFL